MTPNTIRRALISVSDKTGIVELGRALASFNVELISTGHTRKALSEAGLTVRDISEVTGFPEMLGGRVKTLHPRVHGGILAVRGDAKHMETLREHKIDVIDLVVCNLYPFRATVARADSTHEEIVENIDIGGPTLIRAAAKNYHDVAVVTDPGQYEGILAEMRSASGALSLETREQLACEAFSMTASYDSAVSAYFVARLEREARDSRNPFLNRWLGGASTYHRGGPLPSNLSVYMERRQALRYGENPHQQAAFYGEPGVQRPCVATAETLHGKELSFNNILDLDSALNLVREFSEPAAVVIKHNNPCGAAIGSSLEEAFAKAYEGDPVSAFGGVIAFNQVVDAPTATQLTEPKRFVECIIAPDFSEEAMEILTTRPTWKKSVRLLRTGELTDDPARAQALDFRCVDGGFLVQTRDRIADDFKALKVVTKRAPTEAELADLRFAWVVCKHVKSNAIVFAKDGMLVGVGAGQMSRVDSVHLATRKAGDRCRGAVLASDAFFPFRDNIDEAAQAGITAVIQPGGSVRDQDSIQACDEHGMAMVLTGIRHFRH